MADQAPPAWAQSLILLIRKEMSKGIDDITNLIGRLEALPQFQNTEQVIHANVVCDSCQRAIVGVRYKCGNCLDYDLCQSCEPFSHEIHCPTHAFIKLRQPTRFAGVTADGTKVPLLPGNIYLEYIQTESPCKCVQVDHKDRILTHDKLKRTDGKPAHGQEKVKIGSSESTKSEKLRYACTVLSNPIFGCDLAVVSGAEAGMRWVVENSGDLPWLRCMKLKRMTGPKKLFRSVHIPPLSPGQQGIISVELSAPRNPGMYRGEWKMSKKGKVFGKRLCLNLRVKSSSGETPGGNSPVEPFPNNCPLSRDLSSFDVIEPSAEDSFLRCTVPNRQLIVSLTEQKDHDTVQSVYDLIDAPEGPTQTILDIVTPDTPKNTPQVSPPKSPEHLKLTRDWKVINPFTAMADPYNLEDDDEISEGDTSDDGGFEHVAAPDEELSDDDFLILPKAPSCFDPKISLEQCLIEMQLMNQGSGSGNQSGVSVTVSECTSDRVENEVNVPSAEPKKEADIEDAQINGSDNKMRDLDGSPTGENPAQINLPELLADDMAAKSVESAQDVSTSDGTKKKQKTVFTPIATLITLPPGKCHSDDIQSDRPTIVTKPFTALKMQPEKKEFTIVIKNKALRQPPKFENPTIVREGFEAGEGEDIIPQLSDEPAGASRPEDSSNPEDNSTPEGSSTPEGNSDQQVPDVLKKDMTQNAAGASGDKVSMLPDGIEGAAEYAIAKVIEAGAGVFKNIMDFVNDFDELTPKQPSSQPLKPVEHDMGIVLPTTKYVPKISDNDAGVILPHSKYVPKIVDEDIGYPITNCNYPPAKPNQWMPKPSQYVPKQGAWSFPEKNIGTVMDTVRRKIERMGFSVTRKVEEMIKERVHQAPHDVNLVISGLVADLLKGCDN